jgi:hypothetical protein
VTKTDINPAEVAKLRREGATWAQVRDSTGTKLISTRFAALLEEAGYDRAGVKPVPSRPARRASASRTGSPSEATLGSRRSVPGAQPGRGCPPLGLDLVRQGPGVFERAPRAVISSQDSRPGGVGRRLSGRRLPGR